MAKGNLFKYLLLAGGALLLLGTLKASQFIDNLRITFTNLSLGGSFTNPRVNATLKIYNPTSLSVRISDLRGAIYYNDNFVANVQTIKEENIQPFQNVFFDLELISTLPDVINLIDKFIKGQIGNDFYFDGTLKVNGVQIPYKGKLQ